MREWWRGGVIYQVYPRSFQDTNGDGVGDLPGIMRRLDHIASLGVDCIWLSPITQSPQADMGYDVSDYKEVDRLFGSLEDFDSLVQRAHALGLKVIMDQVLSHTSDLHPWFRESRLSRTNSRADWYVWADPKRDGSPPNNWPAVFGGRAWEWNPSRGQYYLHNFLASQPDLNFHNPDVQDALLDVMRFWLERGVDGFRLDTVNYYFHDAQLRNNPATKLPKHLAYAVNPYDMQEHRYSKSQPENVAFLKRVRKLLNDFPGTTTVGEVGDSHKSLQLMSEYTAGNDRLHMCYSFDMLGPEFSAEHFRSRVTRVFSGGGDSWACWSFSNHDVPRHVTRWREHSAAPRALAAQSAMLLLTLRGSVCLYQGEELGLPETDLLFDELTDPRGIRFWPEDKGRDGCRTPIPWEEGEAPNGFTSGTPWLPIKPEQAQFNVAGQNADPDSTLNFYRAALAFRKAHSALFDGDIEFFKVNEPLLAFRRSNSDESLVCLYNLSADSLKITLEGDAEIGLSQAAEWRKGKLALGPNGFIVLAEREENRLRVEFKRRVKKPSN
ncbi:MAG: alpha-glucosidase [Hyphomicrobiales bacterium]|nr:MAG: alpha-glucosidase [Hyphomicrobiales bacterium]